MSKADRRAATILAMVSGSAVMLQNYFNTRMIEEAVSGLARDAKRAMSVFVPDGEYRQCLQIGRNLQQFGEIAADKEVCNTSVLAYLTTQLMDDLLLLVKNREKREALERCYRWADQIIQVSDPEDIAIDCRRAADRAIGDLYRVVGEA